MEHLNLMDMIAGVEWRRIGRYAAVSLAGVVVTQVLLFSAQATGLPPVTANVVAVSLAAVPVFVVNRAWVWELSGPASVRREMVPFWGFTFAGLALSTAAVAAVSAMTTSAAAVAVANLGAFGVLWVAKFVVLDEYVFGRAATTSVVAGTP